MRKSMLSWLLVGLLLMPLAAFAQDDVEVEVEDGGELALGEPVEGELEPGVRVRYTYTPEEDGVVNVYLDGATSDTDTYLRLYEEDAEEPFAENDDRGDGSLSSAVEEVDVTAGEALIVEVGGFGDETEGGYTVRVTAPATAEDAGEIAIGDSADGEFEPGVRYRYTLTVDDPAVVDITLDGEDDADDTFLRIYAEGEDAPLGQNDDAQADDLSAGFLGLVLPADTTIVIEAATFGDTGAGAYTLSVEEADVEQPEPAEVTALDGQSADEVCEGAEDVEEPTRLTYLAPDEVLEDDTDYGAAFCTEAGNWLVDLYEEEAPITVNSFVFLANNRFFDQTTFHRVIPEFVVQGGDPTGTGFGGPGYEFVNETDNDLTFGDVGVLGMANAGPDTNGSQFFITLEPVDRLDGGYTIFGQVTEGQESVENVEERDPETATEPGDTLYTVRVVTLD